MKKNSILFNVITLFIFIISLSVSSILIEIFTKNEYLNNIIAYVISFFLLILWLKKNKILIDKVNITQVNKKKLLKVIFYSILYFVITNIVLDIVDGNIGLNISNLSNFDNVSILSWITIFIGVVIFPAIVEEFFFRGVIFRNLISRFGVKRSILISSLIFSLLHGISIGLIIFLVGSSIYSAHIYYKEKNIIYPIVFHGVNNLLCIFPQLNSIHKIQLENKLLLVFFLVIALPFVLWKKHQIFIVEKDSKISF